jgi:hypothetical protein
MADQKTTMFALTVQAQQINNLIIEHEGEIDAALELVIENHELDVASKTDRIAFVISEMKNTIENLKAREKEVAQARKFAETALERLEERTLTFISDLGKESTEGNLYSLGKRKTSGRVVVDDLEALPQEYKTTKVVIDADKKALKDVLALGVDVPGAKIVYEPTLKITVRK